MEEEYSRLKTQRGRIQASLTRIVNFIDAINQEAVLNACDAEKIKIRLIKVDDLWDKYCSVYSELEMLDLKDEEVSNVIMHEVQFEDQYVKIKSKMNNILQLLLPEKEIKTDGLSVARAEASPLFNMPAIKLPIFSGKYEDWVTFYGTFKSLVHDEVRLSNVQKFHYLVSCLQGPAADLIKSVSISDDNYLNAWNLVYNRYNNNKIIIETHLKAITGCNKLREQSAIALQRYTNNLEKHLEALKLFDLHIDKWDTLLLHILTPQLDYLTFKQWEESTCSSTQMPTVNNFIKFLRQKCLCLESIQIKSSFKPSYKNDTKDNAGKTKCLMTANNNCVCYMCNGTHTLFKCKSFLGKEIPERESIVSKLYLCRNCFSKAHKVKDCRAVGCKHCGKKHNTLLHVDSVKTEKVKYETVENTPPEKREEMNLPSRKDVSVSSVGLLSFRRKVDSQVILPTAVIMIEGFKGKLFKCRVVLDSGSMLNFISDKFYSLLKLNKFNTHASIKGVGLKTTHVKHYVNARVFSQDYTYSKILKFHILPKLSDCFLPNLSFDKEMLNIPDHIKINLADPDFSCSSQIDALIGVEVLLELFDVEQSTHSHTSLFRNSRLGWVAMGKVSFSPDSYYHIENEDGCSFMSVPNGAFPEDNELSDVPIRKSQIEENIFCEHHFKVTHKRALDGKFVVELPLKRDPLSLGNTLEGARIRYLNLERKLLKNEAVYEQYRNFIKEYKDLNHLELVPPCEIDKFPNYYLPHHPVFKESSTTNIRVVFDASFKGSNDISLNDILVSGPALQNDLFLVLLQFRMYKYAMTGDICKMYRMIKLSPEQTDLHRILWRDSPHEPLQHFRLLTVTYGTSVAPFLAIRCLLQSAFDAQNEFTKAANVIKNQFYVDDLLVSEQDENTLKTIQQQVTCILGKAGFQLRKFCSNSKNLMTFFSSISKELHHTVDIGTDGIIKALGLIWRPSTDNFEFKVHENNSTGRVTKRKILSDIAKFFDPLGFLSPVLILAKCFIQELWQAGLTWDESLPTSLEAKWLKYREELQLLLQLKIPRHVGISRNSQINLHGFCDASEKAYGCVIYVLVEHESGAKESRLLCARGRVASMKQVTLPRLELCAAVLLVELMKKVCNIFSEHEVIKNYWTDSEIVLGWIGGLPQQWKTYVGNRVARVQELSSIKEWHHVPSGDNSADIVSRGMKPSQFIECKLWWSGPSWLVENAANWPRLYGSLQRNDFPDKKILKYSLIADEGSPLELAERYSSWSKLLRITSLIWKFYNNCEYKLKNKKSENEVKFINNQPSQVKLSVDELNRAKTHWCKIAQNIEFERELNELKNNKQVYSSSKLKSLSPYLDEKNLIRVGGRLNSANISNDRKHPIVLPAKCIITKLIFEHVHKQNLHVGPQGLLAFVRNEFWPLNGKNIAKATVHKCVICFKAKPKTVDMLMGQLPSQRVNPTRAFTVTGVDFCGPVYIKSGIRRVCKIKAYVAVFVCFCTRAIHLELVSDLSTHAFLAALTRFMSIRGKCSDIFSDNATNFVGANRELQNVLFNNSTNKSIEDYCVDQGIKWHFIPPGSPHMGGLWEAAVKAFKYHFVRTAGKTLLDFEQLSTLLCQIGACLNSRPLTPISSDPSDYTPLTPAHFLVGGSLSIPETPDFSTVPGNRLKRWQLVQATLQHFWKRWSEEYLTSLQQRFKWTKNNKNLVLGTLVLLKEEGLSPLHWRLGRIIELHPGKDDLVRVASVKLANGVVFKRAVVKLCPLPISSEDQQELLRVDQKRSEEI